MLETLDANHDIIQAIYTLGVPLINDREFIYLENRKHLPDGTKIVVVFSIPRNDVPVPSGCVRGTIVASGFVISPLSKEPGKETCKCMYLVQVDPAGWIPVWYHFKTT